LQEIFGFAALKEGEKLGWLVNMQPSSIRYASGDQKSCVDYYFLAEDGDTFKVLCGACPCDYCCVCALLCAANSSVEVFRLLVR
jgi:DNA polymerase epsilon subunit 1